MILRDRDANTAWEDQADGTLEERAYLCQNWRADVVALMTSDGHLINQVRCDGLTSAAGRRGGVPFGIAKPSRGLGLDGDGDVDGDDYTRFSTLHSGGTHPYADWNFDGTVNTSDITAFLNDYNADTGLGRGDPGYDWSHAGGALRKAYAGYEIDPILTGAEGWESLYHVRHRVYLSQLGRWTRRNPLGYVAGELHNLFGYVGTMPIMMSDPTGLPPGRSGCGGAIGNGIPVYILPHDNSCANPYHVGQCQAVCDAEPATQGALQCSNGELIICVCDNDSSNQKGRAPEYRDERQKCIALHEQENAKRNCECPPGGSGDPICDGTPCNEATAYAVAATCIDSIDCNAEADDLAKAWCEFLKCAESTKFQCLANKFQQSCNAGDGGPSGQQLKQWGQQCHQAALGSCKHLIP